MRERHHWHTITASEAPFLRSLFAAMEAERLEVFSGASSTRATFDRARCGGLVLALGEKCGREVAIAWSDFRVNAGCFDHTTANRFTRFLRELRERGAQSPPPLFYVVSSAGVSLAHGRALFADAFRIWPELLAYSRETLVVTCAVGKCLGLAAPLFGLGHYRMAVAGRTHINLTGPEVIRMFFGDRVDYASAAAAETQHARTDLVHELVPSLETAFERWSALIAPAAATPAGPALDAGTAALLDALLDPVPREVVPGWCDRVRLFVGTRRGRALGLFVNPPGRPDNLITARTLEKYAAGFDLFRALRLPVVSFLDSPGLDPRFEESDANQVRKMLAVGEKMIDYPYPSMGVVAGRCFGGASTLSIPKIFGGRRAIALRGSTLGIMQGRIIDELLRQCPRQLALWRRAAEQQRPGLEDLLEAGMLDAVVERDGLGAEIDALLAPFEPWPRRPLAASWVAPLPARVDDHAAGVARHAAGA